MKQSNTILVNERTLIIRILCTENYKNHNNEYSNCKPLYLASTSTSGWCSCETTLTSTYKDREMVKYYNAGKQEWLQM